MDRKGLDAHIKRVTLALSVAALTFVNTAQANLVTNGSFETGAFVGDGLMSLNPGSAAIAGWTVFSGEILWEDNLLFTNYGVSASEGTKFLDLTGHDTVPYGGVEQTIATTPGLRYVVDFDFGTNPARYGGTQRVTAAAAAAASVFEFTGTGDTQQYQHYSLPFTATSASTLISFVGSGPAGGVHAGLDNVVVMIAVPEPSSAAMLAIGMIGLLTASCWRRVWSKPVAGRDRTPL